MSQTVSRFAFAISGVFISASAMAGPNQCVVAARGHALTIRGSATELDAGGNPIAKKRSFLARKLMKDPAAKLTQKAPRNPEYFLATFRAENEVLIAENKLSLAQLADTSSRFYSMEDLTSHEQFYLFRTDADLNQPLSSVHPSQLIVYSFIADRMQVSERKYSIKHGMKDSDVNTNRATLLSSFAGGTDRPVYLGRPEDQFVVSKAKPLELFTYKINDGEYVLKVSVRGEMLEERVRDDYYNRVNRAYHRLATPTISQVSEGEVIGYDQLLERYRAGD